MESAQRLKQASLPFFIGLFFFLSLILTRDVFSQDRLNPLGELSEVFLVTVGPGPLVWERFGHNALWVRDPESGFDRVYHWGLFDFQSENFWPKFLQGYMDYSIGSVSSSPFFTFNMENDRSIWVQSINMKVDQKNALVRFLRKNDSDGNRIYRYDYYLDNCSTRARDALDTVLGGIIKSATQDTGSGTSFRSNTRRLLQMMPGPYLGIQLGLGHPADKEISIWQDMFTAMALRRHLNTLKLPNGDPLILSDKLLYNSSKIREPESIRSYLWFFLPISGSLGILFAILGYLSTIQKKTPRFLFGLFGTLWTLLSGLAGTVLLLIWFFTEHHFGHWNENLLQFNPLSLVLAVCFVIFMLRGQLPHITIKVLYAVTALSLLGFAIQIIPAFDQVNAEIIALSLPAHLGLLWSVRTADHVVVRQNKTSQRVSSNHRSTA